MKHRSISTAFLLVLMAPMLLGQPLPDFLQLSGFQHPSIRSGQFEISLSPQYQYGPFSDSTWSTMMGPRPVELEVGATQRRFQFQTSFLYGIDDRTAASASLSFLPRQSIGDESYNTESVGWPVLNSRGVEQSSQLDETSISVGFVLTHRPRQNIELNLGGFYLASSQPSIKSEGQKARRRSGHFRILIFTISSPVRSIRVSIQLSTPHFPISTGLISREHRHLASENSPSMLVLRCYQANLLRPTT